MAGNARVRAKFQEKENQHRTTFPAEAEAGPSQCLENILQESTEKTNRMANRDLENVVLSLATEGFRQTTLGSASPAARVPSACSRLPGLQLSCRKGNR